MAGLSLHKWYIVRSKFQRKRGNSYKRCWKTLNQKPSPSQNCKWFSQGDQTKHQEEYNKHNAHKSRKPCYHWVKCHISYCAKLQSSYVVAAEALASVSTFSPQKRRSPLSERTKMENWGFPLLFACGWPHAWLAWRSWGKNPTVDRGLLQ